MNSPAHAIEVAALEKRYGPTSAVDGISFSIAIGEVFGLLGPNGAGKTTTVEILEGYRRADAGEVRVLGVDPWRDGDQLRPRIGVMLQEGGLYPGVRPLEALEVVRLLLRRSRRTRALCSNSSVSTTRATRWCGACRAVSSSACRSRSR